MSQSDLELRSIPSHEEVTRSPKRRKRQTLRHYELDGIIEDKGDFLPRRSLVNRVLKQTRENGLLIVSSPPGTGKTSLLGLLLRRFKEERETATGFYLRPSRPSKQDFDLYSYVKETTGVSYEENTLAEHLESKSEIWILFDDAQRLYEEKFSEFWEDVVKTRWNPGRFGTTKLRVVVAATYYLTSCTTLPVAFQAERRIGVEQLLLQKSEAKELFELRSKYPMWEDYRDALYYLTNGHAAAFTIGMNIIYDETETLDRKSTNKDKLDQSTFLQERLIQNDGYLGQLRRCFASAAIDTESHQIILNTLVDAYSTDMGERTINDITEGAVVKLQKAGILNDGGRFSSPVAARFYYKVIFPKSLSPYSEQPDSLDELIRKAIKQLSASRLRKACTKSKECPTEAVFQQLFHEAIASLLPLTCRIIPEYGTEALFDGVHKTGELDFYIRNGKRWALELLCNGKKISEHLSRIPGKYRNVVADEWLVVDCRMGKEPCKRNSNQCSLIFSDDFRTCVCYMRMEAKSEPFSLME